MVTALAERSASDSPIGIGQLLAGIRVLLVGAHNHAHNYLESLEAAGALVTAPYDAVEMPELWVDGAPNYDGLVLVLGLKSVRDQALIQGLRSAGFPCAGLAVVAPGDAEAARASIESGAEVYGETFDRGSFQRAVRRTVARTQQWRQLLGLIVAPAEGRDFSAALVEGRLEHPDMSVPSVQGMLRVLTQVAPLSVRERQVLEEILGGASNQEISEHLRIRVRTVKFHVTNLILKLDARNRTDILRVYFNHV